MSTGSGGASGARGVGGISGISGSRGVGGISGAGGTSGLAIRLIHAMQQAGASGASGAPGAAHRVLAVLGGSGASGSDPADRLLAALQGSSGASGASGLISGLLRTLRGGGSGANGVSGRVGGSGSSVGYSNPLLDRLRDSLRGLGQTGHQTAGGASAKTGGLGEVLAMWLLYRLAGAPCPPDLSAEDRELEALLLAALRAPSGDADNEQQRLARLLLEAISRGNAAGSPRKLDELIKAADARYRLPSIDDDDGMTKLLEGGWQSVSEVLDAQEPPWKQGHQLDITGRGGLYELEDHRVTVAADAYVNRVMGDADMDISGDYDIAVVGSNLVTVQAGTTGASGTSGASGASGTSSASGASGTSSSSAPSSLTPPGLDKLEVSGTARFEFGDRQTKLVGTVNRHWQGPIVRMVGLDGVICGGAFGRIHAGPSMSLSPLVSGDVYGGAARVSAVRIHVAGMGYRSADAAAWAMGAYIRATSITLEPMISTPSRTTPFSQMKWTAKLGKISLGLLPPVDILFGVLSLLALPFILLINKIRHRPPPPPGPPRVRNRQVGFVKECHGVQVHM